MGSKAPEGPPPNKKPMIPPAPPPRNPPGKMSSPQNNIQDVIGRCKDATTDTAMATSPRHDIGELWSVGHAIVAEQRRSPGTFGAARIVEVVAAVMPDFKKRVEAAREKLQEIVCIVPPDDGVLLLSSDGPCHPEMHDGKVTQVYNHEHFSPLGDALIALHEILSDDTSKP